MSTNKPRILHIDSEYGWRGGQQQVAYIFESLHNMGYKTALVCQPDSELEAHCRDRNLTVYPMRMYGEIAVLSGLKIARLCRKEQFNILHLHSSHAMSTGIWSGLFYNAPKMIGVRRVDFHIRKNPFSYFKYNGSAIDKIVCISDQIRKVLTGDGIPDHRSTTIHSGVDLHKFDTTVPAENFRESMGVTDDHVLVGTVAAFVGHKDYPNLLHAARIVMDQTDNVTFCAVGDGPKKEEMLALAHQLNLGSRFVFAGYRTDVGNFLKSFDIFVLASHLEGLGTSILDAQGVGLPVVGCRTGGIPEAVQDNINGLLVPPKNAEALARAILDLVRNESKRKQLGEKAKDTVKEFSIEKTVQKNINLYEQLLK